MMEVILRVHFTPIRVVCANTLAIAARNGRGQGVSIIHKGDLKSKVQQAQEVLGLAKQFYDEAEEQINRLARHYPSQRQLESIFVRSIRTHQMVNPHERRMFGRKCFDCLKQELDTICRESVTPHGLP